MGGVPGNAPSDVGNRIATLVAALEASPFVLLLDQLADEAREGAKSLQRDAHLVACQFLSGFDCVWLPILDTQSLSKKWRPNGKRGISSEVVNKMQGVAHGLFRQRLRHACWRTGAVVYWCPETHSSKMCHRCDRVNGCLGSSKTFVCPWVRCGLVCDRDVNAAVNVFRHNAARLLGLAATRLGRPPVVVTPTPSSGTLQRVLLLRAVRSFSSPRPLCTPCLRAIARPSFTGSTRAHEPTCRLPHSAERAPAHPHTNGTYARANRWVFWHILARLVSMTPTE